MICHLRPLSPGCRSPCRRGLVSSQSRRRSLVSSQQRKMHDPAALCQLVAQQSSKAQHRRVFLQCRVFLSSIAQEMRGMNVLPADRLFIRLHDMTSHAGGGHIASEQTASEQTASRHGFLECVTANRDCLVNRARMAVRAAGVIVRVRAESRATPNRLRNVVSRQGRSPQLRSPQLRSPQGR
jgi:hypothetical protein